MNVYSIGRDPACNIVINDNTDVVSRRHAILNVYPSGKMTIVDQSHNGTYVKWNTYFSECSCACNQKRQCLFCSCCTS